MPSDTAPIERPPDGVPVTPPCIALEFPATDLEVRNAAQTLRRFFHDRGVGGLSLGRIEMVIAEVCNNIVEHAYDQKPTGTISIRATHLATLAQFEIKDKGGPMPGHRLPEKRGSYPTPSIANLPEGGFGWGLIRDLTLSLSYARQHGVNRLNFSIMLRA